MHAAHRNLMVVIIPGRSGGEARSSARKRLNGSSAVTKPRRVEKRCLYEWPSESCRMQRYGLPSLRMRATRDSQSERSPDGPPHSQMPERE